MSTAHAMKDPEQADPTEEPPGVILSPEEEARLVERLAQVDESERTGKLIPWEKIRAERGI
jgi:hypothetical protein